MSESKLADPVIRQINAVMCNKRYHEETREVFILRVCECVGGWITRFASRSQCEHLNGDQADGRSD